MNNAQALTDIRLLLEDSLELFSYLDDEDEHADIYWDIKDVISTIEKRMEGEE